MDNVLIQFGAETSDLEGKLRDVYDQLDEMQSKERQLQLQAEQLNESMRKGNKAVKDGLSDVNQELKLVSKGVAKLHREADQLEKKISNGVASKKLVTDFRNIRDEMAKLELEGKQGGERWNQLTQDAVKLQTQLKNTATQINSLSSVTKELDAAMGVGRGMVGTFAIAQSSMALLGGENEELQKAFFKVQAALQILNGAQSVANVLHKNSVANIVIRNALGKKTVAVTSAEAVATTTSTKATVAGTAAKKVATAAQLVWNRAILAFPVFWLIAGIGALVGAISWLTSSQKSHKEVLKEINELEQLRIDRANRLYNEQKRITDERVKELQHELDLMKAQGKSEGDIAIQQRKILEERLSGAQEVYDANKSNIDQLEEQRKELAKLQAQQEEWRKAKLTGEKVGMDISKKDGSTIKVDFEVTDDALEALQQRIDNVKSNIDLNVNIEKELDAAGKSLTVFEDEQETKLRERARESAIAAAQLRVLEARKGTAEELRAREQGIRVARDVELSNVNLTMSERRLIVAKAEEDIRKLRLDYNVRMMQDEVAGYEAQLAVVKKNSQEELDLRLEILKKQRDIELANVDLTENQRSKLTNEHLKQSQELRKQYNAQLTQDELNSQISTLNARLSAVKEGTAEELRLRKDLLEKQAELDLKALQNSEINEDLKAAKVIEVNAKLYADLEKLQQDYLKRQQDTALTFIRQQYELERIEAEKQLASGGIFQQIEAREKLKQVRLNALASEKSALDESLAAGLISEAEFQQQLTDLTIEGEQLRLEAIQEAAEAEKEIRQALFDFGMQLADAFYQSKKDRLAQELSDLNHYYTTDANEAKKNANLRLISEEEMKERTLKIKREQAKAEKEQAIFEAQINAALAISKALSSAPPPYNVILAAIAGAAAQVQVSAIKSKPLPKYWKGKKADGDGHYAMVGEHGPEVMYIPKGAGILPAHSSRSVASALNAMPRFEIPVPSINIPEMPSVMPYATTVAGSSIDYRKLGKTIAENVSMPEVKQLNLNLDKEGFSSYLVGKNSIIVTKNITTSW